MQDADNTRIKDRNTRAGTKFLKHTMNNNTFYMQSGLSNDNLIIYKYCILPKHGVYGIFNKTKHKLYIGSTTNLQVRKRLHEQYLRRGKHPCKEMQKDFMNNDVFTFNIFEEFDEIAPDDLAGLEETYIKKLFSLKKPMNHTSGDGMSKNNKNIEIK